MRWQAKATQAQPIVVWVCLVLAVASYGAAVVRNVTDTLAGIAGLSHSVVLVKGPSR